MSSNHKQNVQNALNSDRATSNNTSLPEWVQKAKMLEDSKDGTSYNDGFVHQKSTEGKVYMVTKELGAYIDYDIDIRRKNNTYRGWSYKLKKKLQPGDFILITHQIRSVYYQGKHYEVLGGKYKEGNNWSGLYVFWTIYQGVNKIKEVPVDKSKPLNVFVLVEGTKDPLNFGSSKFKLDSTNYATTDNPASSIMQDLLKKGDRLKELDYYNYSKCERNSQLVDIVFLDGIKNIKNSVAGYEDIVIPENKPALLLYITDANHPENSVEINFIYYDEINNRRNKILVPKDRLSSLIKTRYFSRCFYKLLNSYKNNNDLFIIDNQFFWEGDNNIQSRKDAGRVLIVGDHINDGLLRKYEKSREINFHLISHSHGGNVVIHALNFIKDLKSWPQNWQIKSTTFLSTPFQKPADIEVLFARHNFFAKDHKTICINNPFDLTQQFLAAFNLDIFNPDLSVLTEIFKNLDIKDLLRQNSRDQFISDAAAKILELAKNINTIYYKTNVTILRVLALALDAVSKNIFSLKASLSIHNLVYTVEPLITLVLDIFGSPNQYHQHMDNTNFISYNNVISQAKDKMGNPISRARINLDYILEETVRLIIPHTEFYSTYTTDSRMIEGKILSNDRYHKFLPRNKKTEALQFVKELKELNIRLENLFKDKENNTQEILNQLTPYLTKIVIGSIPIDLLSSINKVIAIFKNPNNPLFPNRNNSVTSFATSIHHDLKQLIESIERSQPNFRYQINSSKNIPQPFEKPEPLKKGGLFEMFTESHSLSHTLLPEGIKNQWNLNYTPN